MSAAGDPLYAEDLAPEREFPFSAYTLDEEDIVAFASRWDPLAIHTDPVAAQDGPFGGLIASGLQTMAVHQRLIVEVLWSRVVGVGGRGFQVRFRRPVPPGTVLTGRARIDRVDLRAERGDAVVHVESRLEDQEGRLVLEVLVDAVVLMRPAAPGA